jgi:3-isopropylmalate dehydrogenase
MRTNEHDTPLKRYKAGEIDFLIVRESTEGLFSVRLSQTDAAKGEVCDVMRISRTGSERVCRAAFEQAMKRRKHCTLVDKVIKFL